MRFSTPIHPSPLPAPRPGPAAQPESQHNRSCPSSGSSQGVSPFPACPASAPHPWGPNSTNVTSPTALLSISKSFLFGSPFAQGWDEAFQAKQGLLVLFPRHSTGDAARAAHGHRWPVLPPAAGTFGTFSHQSRKENSTSSEPDKAQPALPRTCCLSCCLHLPLV